MASLARHPEISDEQLLASTLRESTEESECFFPCADVSQEDLIEMRAASSEVDVDYLMLKEEVSKFFDNRGIQNHFVDATCQIYPSPFKDRIYSATIKELLCIGEIDRYKVSFIYKPKDTLDFQEEEEEGAGEDLSEDVMLSGTLNRNMVLSQVRRVLNDIRPFNRETMNFNTLADKLKTHFPNLILVVYKYGQKLPLSGIRSKLDQFIESGIAMEIALAKQYRLENHFVSVKRMQEYCKFSFSNFLSNTMCNLRINSPSTAAAFGRGCYRLTVYNTLQHQKKNVDLLLKFPTNLTDCRLGNLQSCLDQVNSKLDHLSQFLDQTELRVEMYFSVSNTNDLRMALQCLQVAIGAFQLVKKPNTDVVEHFESYQFLLCQVFATVADSDDCRSFYFFLYYERFLSFLFSTEKMTREFLQSNCGVFLRKCWLDGSSKKLAEEFYEATSPRQVWCVLEAVFGKNAENMQTVYWFLQYVMHFIERLEQSREKLNFAVEAVAILVKRKFTVSTQQLGATAAAHDLYTIMRILMQKSRAVCLSGILEMLIRTCQESTRFWNRLFQVLLQFEFKVHYGNVLYVLSSDDIEQKNKPQYNEVLKVIAKYSYSQFIDLHNLSDAERTFDEKRDYDVVKRYFNYFHDRVPSFNQRFYPQLVSTSDQLFSVEPELVYSFIFLTLPEDFTGKNSIKLTKIVNLIENEKKFIEFLYGACFSFYAEELVRPNTLIKMMENSIAFASYKGNSEQGSLTFNKVIYFSGRFDRYKGRPGIYIDDKKSWWIKSRKGLAPHPQLEKFDELEIDGIKSRSARIAVGKNPALSIKRRYALMHESRLPSAIPLSVVVAQSYREPVSQLTRDRQVEQCARDQRVEQAIRSTPIPRLARSTQSSSSNQVVTLAASNPTPNRSNELNDSDSGSDIVAILRSHYSIFAPADPTNASNDSNDVSNVPNSSNVSQSFNSSNDLNVPDPTNISNDSNVLNSSNVSQSSNDSSVSQSFNSANVSQSFNSANVSQSFSSANDSNVLNPSNASNSSNASSQPNISSSGTNLATPPIHGSNGSNAISSGSESFEAKLNRLFPFPDQKSIIDQLLSFNITEEILRTKNRHEIAFFLKTIQRVDEMIAIAIATILEREFNPPQRN